EQTRDFFNRYVIGAGGVPVIRIGAQPYGILPATPLSRMRWLNQRIGDDRIGIASLGGGDEAMMAYLRQLYPILAAVDQDWRTNLTEVSFVGKAGDPHALLLDIIGLHSGSVEWSQRYAENLATLYNRLNLLGFGGAIQAIIVAAERAAARALVTRLGYQGD